MRKTNKNTGETEIASSILNANGVKTTPLDFAERQRLIMTLERSRSITKKIQKMKAVHTLEHQAAEDAIQELSGIAAYKPQPYFITPSISSGQSETVPVLLLSDWHLEEPVRLGAVRGINAYSLDIYAERRDRLIRKAISLVNYRRKTNTSISEMVIWFGGDFITGHIHPENVATSALVPELAIERAMADLKILIERILAETGIKRLIIPCNVGNHARTTEKTWIGTQAYTNHERTVYYSLKLMFANDSRVNFILPEGQFTEYSVFDKYKIRFAHGDAIKFGGGIGGLMVPLKKRIAAWNAGKNDAYLDCMGHWHTFTPNRRFIVNGSMIGYNSYAQWCGFAPEDPVQTLFYIERQHGLTSIEPIYLHK